jgi:hypothetical protein
LITGTHTITCIATGTDGQTLQKTIQVLISQVKKVGLLSGIIKDGNNIPIAEVTIKIGDYETKSNASGFYSISNIVYGTHNLFISKNGYTAYSQQININQSNTLKNVILDLISLSPEVIKLAPPTNLRLQRKTDVSISIQWNMPSDSLGVVAHSISYKALSGSYSDEIIIESPALVNYQIAGLTPNTSYTFRVKRRNDKGVYSDYSEVTIITDNATLPEDTASPIFTSSNSANVYENQTNAITLTATDSNAITYSINGADSGYFDIIPSLGIVTFKVAPDFETKTTYTFTATAKDNLGNEASQNVTIVILNVEETITILSSSLLKKTGQTQSYKTYDDGYYQAGKTISYTRSNDIVTDNVTGLMWQDDSNVKNNRKTWNDAKSYCSNLTLGGYSDWELPTVKELIFIVDNSKSNPSINSLFQNISSSYYWSSSSFASTSSFAWTVYFSNGDLGNYDNTSSLYMRCVRGRQ